MAVAIKASKSSCGPSPLFIISKHSTVDRKMESQEISTYSSHFTRCKTWFLLPVNPERRHRGLGFKPKSEHEVVEMSQRDFVELKEILLNAGSDFR